MKIKQNSNISITDNIYYICRTILMIGLPILVISALVLNMSHSSARVSSVDGLSVSVLSSCTLSSRVDDEHSISTVNGTYHADVGRTTLTTFCNDRNGYVVYAIGDSLNSEGNNKLVSNINSNYDIASGLATSGNISNWAMKLSANNINTNQNADDPIIEPIYDNQYGLVPTEWTRVVSKPSGTTDMTSGSAFSTTYSIYTSPTQPAGTYTGQVKYLLAHPSSAAPTSAYIMQEIADWEDDLPNPGDTVIATDIRDGKGYYVTRLADGHIWMTQNLDFNITGTTLDSTTTDLNVIYNASINNYREYQDGYTENNGIIYWTPANSATTIGFTRTAVAGWQDSQINPYSANKTDNAETGHNSLGNYYNWTAAIASNDSSSLTTSTYNDISKNPQNSICPRGWRLPTVSSESGATPGSTNEFARLNYLYNNGSTNNDSSLIVRPIWLAQTGRIGTARLEYQEWGGKWSSTISDVSNAYYLSFSSSYVNTARNSGDPKGFGFPVRCVTK